MSENKHKVFVDSDEEEEVTEEKKVTEEPVASTKSEGETAGTSEVKKQRRACKFFLLGRCTKGDACEFSHKVEKDTQIPVCWYVRNKKQCTNEHCPFSHDLKRIFCKHYMRGTCWRGAECPFSHDCPTNEEVLIHKREKRKERKKKQAAAKKRYMQEHPEVADLETAKKKQKKESKGKF